MNAFLKVTAIAAAIAAMPLAVEAHRVWMLPSATVLSGNDAWVTVDAAVSNDLFYFEHNPLRLDGLKVVGPDGQPVAAQNASTGKFRSTFDLHLPRKGTYKVAVVNDGVFARYKLNGETKRWRGTAETIGTGIPAAATDLQVTQSISRLEVFVTVGAPTVEVLKPTGTGLELHPVTHPNNLVVGEAATFALLLDGKPASDVKVTIIPGGIRYRDKLEETTATTGADGRFSVEWPGPGMYWLNASVQDDRATVPGARRRAGYTATVEVLPQ